MFRSVFLGLVMLFIFAGYPAFAESSKTTKHVVSFTTLKYGVKSSYHPFVEVNGSKEFSSVEIGYHFPSSIYGRSFFTGEIEKLISYGVDLSIGVGQNEVGVGKNEVSKPHPMVSFSPFISLYESDSVSVLFKAKLGFNAQYFIHSFGPELTYKINDRFSVGINISPSIIENQNGTKMASLLLGFNIKL